MHTCWSIYFVLIVGKFEFKFDLNLLLKRSLENVLEKEKKNISFLLRPLFINSAQPVFTSSLSARDQFLYSAAFSPFSPAARPASRYWAGPVIRSRAQRRVLSCSG
jgi:hypothetical protein